MDGVHPDDMPFLSLYLDRKILNELGYNSSIDDLDVMTANYLINIHGEIKKQEREEMESNSKKKKRG